MDAENALFSARGHAAANVLWQRKHQPLIVRRRWTFFRLSFSELCTMGDEFAVAVIGTTALGISIVSWITWLSKRDKPYVRMDESPTRLVNRRTRRNAFSAMSYKSVSAIIPIWLTAILHYEIVLHAITCIIVFFCFLFWNTYKDSNGLNYEGNHSPNERDRSNTTRRELEIVQDFNDGSTKFYLGTIVFTNIFIK